VIALLSTSNARWLCTKSRKFIGAFKNRVTLKALANVSPGFALKPWVQKCSGRLFATLKGLRGFAVLQGCQSTTLGWNWRTLSALFMPDKSSQEWALIRLFMPSLARFQR
jgi:hypothetical protein